MLVDQTLCRRTVCVLFRSVLGQASPAEGETRNGMDGFGRRLGRRLQIGPDKRRCVRRTIWRPASRRNDHFGVFGTFCYMVIPNLIASVGA